MTATLPAILVVDDEAALRRVLERSLTRSGYRVVSVGSAEAAYELLVSQPADAVLLDIHLPTMSGLALYLAIVHRWPALEGRIAIMTGDADAEEVQGWLKRHGAPVIRKPFNLEDVSGWVAEVLQRERGRGRGRAREGGGAES
ncbi:MAG TPA: response regulator [Gemmatimonadales bacterium]